MSNGIYTNREIVDSLIIDLNELVKSMVDGQYIVACSTVSQMSQKLVNLRAGIEADLKSKDEKIECLKNQLRECGIETREITPEELLKERSLEQ